MNNLNLFPKLIFIFLLFISCEKIVKHDLSFNIINKKIYNEDRIKIKIFNSSDQDYFVVMDTIDYYDLNKNYSINECIRPIQKFFVNDDSISVNIFTSADKKMYFDSSNIVCKETKKNKSLDFFNKLKELKNIIILKKKSFTNFSIPFSKNYTICDKSFRYDLDKNTTYSVMLNYKKKKQVLNKLVNSAKMKEFNQKGIIPFYGSLNSNIVNISLQNK